jgi:DNA-binding MarR family transcriptional regulator
VLEKDGLIKRTRDNPKSRLLKIELTDKGLKMTEIPRESKAIDSIFAVMNKEQRQQLYEIMNKMFVKAQKVKPS